MPLCWNHAGHDHKTAELFRLADEALEGKPVEFVHQGVVFHITAESKRSKLAKRKIFAPEKPR